MSLKSRIILLFAFLLFLGIAGDIAHMTLNARNRVEAEGDAMNRVTKDFISTALANMRESADADENIVRIVRSLGSLRHVEVAFARNIDGPPASLFAPEPHRGAAPAWFAELVGAQKKVTLLPVFVGGKNIGAVVIASRPADEIDEVWLEARNLALTAGLIAAAALFGASVMLDRTLRPLEGCAGALGRLRDGDYSVRIEASGSPEFVDLCVKINALAGSLNQLANDNRQLLQRLIEVQEDERKKIAHELHDEFGPHLFALRATATILGARLGAPSLEPLRQHTNALREQIEALQFHNKNILRQLRPPALDDLGLSAALRILVDDWRATEPGIDVQLRIAENLGETNNKTSLALYRLVQEALTNIYRHSKAAHAMVTVSVTPSPAEIDVRVEDDGIGIDTSKPVGLGLTGMRERVRALGGRFVYGVGDNGGGFVAASIPINGASTFEREASTLSSK
ncbi:ATP-binding protein [Rhodoblastus sp.]|uniref:ATP-binding protein n=1 Tax=Rhodoblastus sp. TaxID=1962975 RepID=UPI00261D51D2|nr:ATP-binding protein [Rhodoblastus sp.]